MIVPITVAEALKKHVALIVECIDRMYLNVYIPKLQSEPGVVGFFRNHRGAIFASSSLMEPISRAFVSSIQAFIKKRQIPVVRFAKNQRKDDVAKEYLARFKGEEGVLFVGVAQEKAYVFSTEKRRNPQTGLTYPWIVRSKRMVNYYYFYCVDRDFGPFFIKFCSYFPYSGKLCINGHEYVKRQLDQEGIGYTPLDNGIATCDNPERLQQICDGLDARTIEALFTKWLDILPQPLTQEDRNAGYQYQLSVLQAEFSLTLMLDRPLTGRKFFECLIKDNLIIGRPDNVQLIFERRITKRTPGVSVPGSSQRASFRLSIWTINTRGSRYTLRKDAHYASRPRSTTQRTSALASGSRTCLCCETSDSRPTGVSWKSSALLKTRHWHSTP